MKAVAPKPSPRRFHQASWDEPVIFELSQPGARGVLVPPVEPGIAQAVGDVSARLPESLRRVTPPALPEMSQIHVLRHYARLSQENLGVDLNIDIGPGHLHHEIQPQGQRPAGAHRLRWRICIPCRTNRRCRVSWR